MRWLAALCLSVWLLPAFPATAEGPIAVIVSPSHARSLKKDDLVLIYKRKKLYWADGGKVQPVNLPASSALRREFSQAVLGASPEELEKYWNDMYFHGISPPYVLSSEEAVLRFVAETPGAVGYVPFCSAAGRANVAFVISPAGHISEEVSGIECGK